MSNDSTPTRSRILKATQSLLEKSGGQGVRMSDIARQAGVSRQAVYLHFESRADLLAEVTREMDRALDVEGRLAATRDARTGRARLLAYIAFWGHYLPHIEPVARALISMQESDREAAAAWAQRMQDLRKGCASAIRALARDNALAPEWSEVAASDLLWSMMSVEVWVKLRETCGWSAEDYIARMQAAALAAFLRET
jgi:AcrR family transcriptional regulator